VKPDTLTVASLLSIVLLPFHIGGDVVPGFDRGGSGLVFVVVPILLVVACGALLLAERRSGHVIMFLGGLAALAMPIIHRNNGFTVAVARSPGGLHPRTSGALAVNAAPALERQTCMPPSQRRVAHGQRHDWDFPVPDELTLARPHRDSAPTGVHGRRRSDL
jgi:hypothetical protein